MPNLMDEKKHELSNLIASVRTDTETYNQKIRLVIEMRQTLVQYDYYKADGIISDEEKELRADFAARLQQVGADPEIVGLLKRMETDKEKIELLYQELGIECSRKSPAFLSISTL